MGAPRRMVALWFLVAAMLALDHGVMSAASDAADETEGIRALSEAAEAFTHTIEGLNLGESGPSSIDVIKKAKQKLQKSFNAANAKLEAIHGKLTTLTGSKTKRTKRGGGNALSRLQACQDRARAGRARRKAFRAKQKKKFLARRAARAKFQAARKAWQLKARKKRKAARKARWKAMQALRKELNAYKAIASAAVGEELAEAQTSKAVDLAALKKAAEALSVAAATAETAATAQEASAAKAGAKAAEAEKKESAESAQADAAAKKDDKKEEAADAGPVWEGAFNKTQAVAGASNGDGKPITKGKFFCLGQKSVSAYGKTHRGLSTCTKCKPEFVFTMLWHKSKAGKCGPMQKTMTVTCVTLDQDKQSAGEEEKNKMCTKAGIVQQAIPVHHSWLKDKKLLKQVAGMNGHAVAHCKLYKQTVCRSGNCSTRKDVTCDKVCKLKGWTPDKAARDKQDKYITEDCSSAPCKTEYSSLFCASVAMMM